MVVCNHLFYGCMMDNIPLEKDIISSCPLSTKQDVLNYVDMEVLDMDIEKVRRESRDLEESFRAEAEALALSVVGSRASWQPSVGARELENLANMEIKLSSYSSSFEKASREGRKNSRIEQAMTSAREKIASIDRQLEEKYTRLGALLFSLKSEGRLADEIAFLNDDWSEYDKIMSSSKNGFFNRFVKKWDLSSFEKNQEERFRNYGKLLFDRKLENYLITDDGVKLVLEIRMLLDKRDAQLGSYGILSSKISPDSPERDEIDGMQNLLSAKRSDYSRMLLDYGLMLFENGEKWVDQDTPSTVLDHLGAMLETEGRIRKLRDEEASIMSRLDARHVSAMLDEKLSELERLKKERDGIYERMGVLEDEISRLRLRLEKGGSDV